MIKIDITLIVIEIVLAVALWILADVSRKYESSKWKLCYLVPAIVCFIAVGLGNYESSMLPAYIGSAILLVGFFKENALLKKGSCVVSVVLTIAAAGVSMNNPGYRMYDFVKDFETGFQTMKEHYCLAEHKGIDWDALHDKYIPKFKQARANCDKVENFLLWQEFTAEFHDGHVNFSSADEVVSDEAIRRAFGKDFGLSFLRLDDGTVVAVNVEKDSEAEKAGIYNGCQIISWAGKDPVKLAEQVMYQLFASPDIENENLYRMFYVAGFSDKAANNLSGGVSSDANEDSVTSGQNTSLDSSNDRQVTVAFLDKEGNTKQATLSAIGDYFDRLEKTIDIFDQGMNIGTLTFAEISDDTVLYRIKAMSYDATSYMDGNFSALQEQMEEKLLEYKEQGKTRLVIDLRSNQGGSPQMILAMAELLAEEGEHFYTNTPVINPKTLEYPKEPTTGKYLVDETLTYRGRDLWGHGEIIVLVNGECVSAGDHFTRMLSKMDNVTIMGMTKSNSSGQAIRGYDGISGSLSFSAIPTLDENGDIYIDPGIDRISKMPLDVKIPVDETAVHMLFDEGKDYVLWYAMQ